MPKLADIPKFIWGGNYAVDVHFCYLESWLADRGEKAPVDMDPDFQRGHVWNDRQRSKYVEFLLRGGQSSFDIYWNQPEWPEFNKKADLPDVLMIVDGKQRVTAVRMFMRNELKVFGHYLDEWEDGEIYAGFHGPHLRMHVNNLETRKELLQWYLELNDGGVVHTKAEIERVRDLLRAEEGASHGL